MKILLTGGTGFLGKNLTKILRETYGPTEVRPVGSACWDLRESKYSDEVIDRFKPEVVIHAAGSVGGIGANQENPGKFMYENLIMGANLIEAARNFGIDKFVLLGTVCAYPKFTPVPFEEKQIWNGYPEETNAPYGIAKKALMKLLETYNEQYEMNCANLIPVNMYGPHDHFNLTSSHVIPALILKFYNAMKAGERQVTIWGTGEASREFLYAEDCCEALETVMDEYDNLSCDDELHITTGVYTTVLEIAEEIKSLFAGIGKTITVTPAQSKDEVQKDARNEPDLYINEFWQYKTSVPEGLKKVFEEMKKDYDS